MIPSDILWLLNEDCDSPFRLPSPDSPVEPLSCHHEEAEELRSSSLTEGTHKLVCEMMGSGQFSAVLFASF